MNFFSVINTTVVHNLRLIKSAVVEVNYIQRNGIQVLDHKLYLVLQFCRGFVLLVPMLFKGQMYTVLGVVKC